MSHKIVPGASSTAGSGVVYPTKGSNENDVSIKGDKGIITIATQSVEKQQIIQQLEKAIRAVQGPEKTFEISIHEQTHAIMVKVFDKQSGDLIREIPSEKLLDVAANLMELSGIIVDERV
ncbi:flagellar protein FlaG [Paenibacillus sp. FSL R5-0887]|uniref:flagellar protein FlaG n=1 Tax=Paenibacillus sp. FSL R5-0887 TaxID=2921662 RepID=UPI0030FBDE91